MVLPVVHVHVGLHLEVHAAVAHRALDVGPGQRADGAHRQVELGTEVGKMECVKTTKLITNKLIIFYKKWKNDVSAKILICIF